MPSSFYGMPLHPLIVHATVVMIPLAALTVLLSVAVPRFRVWSGPLPLVLSVIGLILVPLSTSTGETLERHVPRTALLEEHTHMAEGLLPWMIALVVASGAMYYLLRRGSEHRNTGRALRIGIAALAIVSVVGTTVQVARIGHSGAKSAWQNTDMSSQGVNP